MKGGRRQGRQRKRWEDNIREWTVLEFGKPQRAVENREKWRKLVAKSSVVPQRIDDDDESLIRRFRRIYSLLLKLHCLEVSRMVGHGLDFFT